MKSMRENQIPEFVREIIATGCDMRAVGDHHYLVGDSDLSEEAFDAVEKDLDRIWTEYGNHDHLKYQIIGYLHSIGRSYPPPVMH
ncbi:hypothetical protein [Pseudorhizobium flavum]|uniref:Uncharacterized protein n=1 Tax=Pseudorhizobium flavum TaxID=1335061 RepID=A0A7W9Z0A6_9HYPH|nr:hypothetical protein [Pseudorhizobium flavum]MBB6181678.1 hypothetical protein [Pseudorhizobium flavum]CAD6619139.1 hypothetical protein RFYW14_03789 [Pseudorhizobium flavum]